MLFMSNLRQKILEGTKTQTRRPVKSGETIQMTTGSIESQRVYSANGRLKWETGREYAVQYGRGMPTCLIMLGINSQWREIPLAEIAQYADRGARLFKIKIISIRKEKTRDISDTDIIAEGLSSRDEFMKIWEGFYEDNFPVAWVIEFKVIQQ